LHRQVPPALLHRPPNPPTCLQHYARQQDGLEYFLTYADNNAVGYFSKQSFTKVVTLEKDMVGGWAGWARVGIVWGCALLWSTMGSGCWLLAAAGHFFWHAMRWRWHVHRPMLLLPTCTCAPALLFTCTCSSALHCPVLPCTACSGLGSSRITTAAR
jgi:hypothetical protein